jgi:hypothetical protein
MTTVGRAVRPRTRRQNYTLTLLQNRNNQLSGKIDLENEGRRRGLKNKEINPAGMMVAVGNLHFIVGVGFCVVVFQ